MNKIAKKPLLMAVMIAMSSIGVDAYVMQEGKDIGFGKTPLLNQNITNLLVKESPWKESHGADNSGFLGAGLFYYTIPYMSKAKTCVCLGTGGAFVPRMMRQAQRDLNMRGSKTIVVDGDMGGYGRPKWLKENSVFRANFPDVEIIIDTTENVAIEKKDSWKIDYLHIDADHSYEGCMADFRNYYPMMSKNGIITIHDTGRKRCDLPCRLSVKTLRKEGYNIVNFFNIGGGFAVVQLGDEDEK